MFIGPCNIAIVDEWKTSLMSLAILFHLLCAQHISDINPLNVKLNPICHMLTLLGAHHTFYVSGLRVNISIFRSLRLCWWITTSVVLFSVHCVWELLLRLVFDGVRFAGFPHTTNWEQDDRCGDSSTQSQAPEDGYINVRNMLST